LIIIVDKPGLEPGRWYFCGSLI